jgi:hypothetical protein
LRSLTEGCEGGFFYWCVSSTTVDKVGVGG